MNSSVPIYGEGIIPVSNADVAAIPPIALSIPDFEGEAILRIFSNTSQSQIACFSAVLTNGATFSHPAAVGSVLGVFTFIALLASFATAIYGEAVPTMRLHYAHSLSVGVVFAVWHHIFFTGALSVNWPSVLPAWWSNFAWAGGMIYSSSMQNSINNLIGNNIGNTSSVGAAQTGSDSTSVGGGYDISLLYKRAFTSGMKRAANHPLYRNVISEIYGRDPSIVLRRDIVQRNVERALQARATTDIGNDGYQWGGTPVPDGLPLPGNYSGFAGTLSPEGIRVSNAFMTGLLWFIILLVLVVAATVAFKWSLEGLAHFKAIKENRLKFFRDHWIGYAVAVLLRSCYIAFFMIMFLTIFQFTYESAGGVKAIAAIFFILFFVGMLGVAAYAYWYKLNITETGSHAPGNERKTLLSRMPWFGASKNQVATTDSPPADQDPKDDQDKSSVPWKRAGSTVVDRGQKSIHDDEDYIMKFGWLAARFRRTRWWFFTYWLLYEFIRAVFYGGASGFAQAQVFGLLVIELVAFAFVIWMRPFEGQRLNIIVVYCLGFSKVTSVGLSAAFFVSFNVARIPTTVVGVVIIVIQGILTIITMIAIVIGAISSYMSVSRNREDFRPRKWHGRREKYFDHMDKTVRDLPKVKKVKAVPPPPEEPKYGFEMTNVRRMAKIEDEDADFAHEMLGDANASQVAIDENRSRNSMRGVSGSRPPSRAQSVKSVSTVNLPYGARPHRPSWSTRDFQRLEGHGGDGTFEPVDMSRTISDEGAAISKSAGKAAMRTPSRSATMPVGATIAPQTSRDSLRVGGNTSTLDTIGDVPAPTVRPRAGTGGSRGPPRSISSTYGLLSDANRSVDQLSVDPDSRPGSARNSQLYHPSTTIRGQVLTPAQEMEEWTIPPTTTRQE